MRGDLVVEPYTSHPDLLLGPGCRLIVGDARGDVATPRAELRVEESSPFGDGLLIHFEGLGNRDVAGRWRDRFLLVPSEEIPPAPAGEIFIHDLVGLRVEAMDGSALGTVTAFYELAQGLMLDVKGGPGREFLLPYRDEFVQRVDMEQRLLVVDLPEGFLE